jgi:hypothetical protein
MLTALLSDLWPYIAAAGAAIALWLGNNVRQRTKGRKEAETDNLKDAVEREKRGRDAVVEEQSDAEGLSNSDIVERMRGRDDDFTGL